MASSVPKVTPQSDKNYYFAPRSFWRRKWHWLDVLRLVTIVGLHLLCLVAPFYFSWSTLRLSVLVGLITGMFGITVSYHRNLTHKSFTLPKWLEHTFAYCGVLAYQGDPIDWVSTHRYHHKYVDTKNDPHSPIEGFWFSHWNWTHFDRPYLIEKCGERAINASDLRKQPFYRFIAKTYYVHHLALGLILYSMGGFAFVVWGLAVPIVSNLHISSLTNSVGHTYGNQDWNNGDLSKNNWWVALLTVGEGWHNNHHAFEYSARHGLEWWQIDMTWGVIRLLQAAGLATNVKLPSAEHKKKLAFPSSKIA